MEKYCRVCKDPSKLNYNKDLCDTLTNDEFEQVMVKGINMFRILNSNGRVRKTYRAKDFINATEWYRTIAQMWHRSYAIEILN